MAKETYVYGKRDPLVWQKRPTYKIFSDIDLTAVHGGKIRRFNSHGEEQPSSHFGSAGLRCVCVRVR